MKHKNYILLAVAVLSFCLVIWWFTRTTSATPEKIVAAPTPAKVEAPKQLAPLTIAPPIAPSAPKSDAASVTDMASTDPHAESIAELKVVFADIASLYRAGDLATFSKTYTPPDKLNAQTLQKLQELQQQNQGNPDWVRSYETQAQAYEDMEAQTRLLTPPATKPHTYTRNSREQYRGLTFRQNSFNHTPL